MTPKQPGPLRDHQLMAVSVADAPTQIWRPSPAKVPRRRKWWLVFGVGLLVLFAALLSALAGGAALLYYSDWILPGVNTLGVELGGQTKDDAEARLAAHWQQREIILRAEEMTWTAVPEELGVTLDTVATVAQARAIGRSLESFKRWLQFGGTAEIAPAWQIDMVAAEANLQKLAADFAVLPQDAGLELVNGRFTATEPINGRSLDIPSTMAWLEQSAAQAMLTRKVQLPTVPVAPVVTDVTSVVDEANRLLTTAVTLNAYDPINDETVTWTIPPEQWSQWLFWESDGTQFSWSLDESEAQTFFEIQAQELGSDRFVEVDGVVTAVSEAIIAQNPTINLRIYHHARQHIVQSGETFASIGRAYGMPYPWIQQANLGVSDGLFAGQTLTIPSPDEMLPLPVVEYKRLIVSLSQQKMWAYENGVLKWEWLSSTGIDDSPTSPGVFQIQTHETNAYAGNWDLWMPYFMGIYQPVPTSGFMNGFHGFPTRDGQNLLWTNSLGHQVTYGCVLVSTANAAQLFDWAEAGVVVEIRP